MQTDRIRVAVVGATGYTGAELLRLLLSHPRAEVTALYAREKLTPRVSSVIPSLAGLCELPVEPFDPDDLARRADVAFAALPHGASVACVSALRSRGVKVLDLSADFRLRDAAEYARWYGAEHAAPALLDEAVYGLPELHRELLRGAPLVAVPGCYPTASALPLLPVLSAGGAVDASRVIVHALSGVSGAGRGPGPAYHFPEAAEGARCYKVAGAHRHTPEIEQTLSLAAGVRVTVSFSPTLAPMTRGILATSYAPLTGDVDVVSLVERARAYFEGSPSVAVLDPGQMPDTLWVRGSNRAHVGYAVDRRAGLLVAMCAIDNLVKGASGQAVQCMNLVAGIDEGEGLRGAAMFP